MTATTLKEILEEKPEKQREIFEEHKRILIHGTQEEKEEIVKINILKLLFGDRYSRIEACLFLEFIIPGLFTFASGVDNDDN